MGFAISLTWLARQSLISSLVQLLIGPYILTRGKATFLVIPFLHGFTVTPPPPYRSSTITVLMSPRPTLSPSYLPFRFALHSILRYTNSSHSPTGRENRGSTNRISAVIPGGLCASTQPATPPVRSHNTTQMTPPSSKTLVLQFTLTR
jgi:hypothetical protein